MRIVVLGGAGDMGSRAVEDLAASPDVELVTIADQNVARGREIAAALQKTAAARIEVVPVNANGKDSLVAAMRGHDVAASALGPFHRFETKLVSAALEADVDYASICDEWEPTQKVFDKFSDQAADQGRVILVGLGTSPGATNIAFAHLAARMDTVERADFFCYQPLQGGGGPAVFQHMLHIISGKTQVWRRGKRRHITALSERRAVEFPQFGTLRVWNMGHAEPMTIPRFFPGIHDVNFLMGFGSGSGLFIQPARWGLFNSPGRIDATVALIGWVEAWFRGDPAPGAIRVDVFGTVAGAPVQRMLCGVGHMREVTGVALSIGAQMVVRRELTCRGGGVFAPEACIRPDVAIRAFAARGLQLYDDLAMTRPATVGA